ncbi:hypothetical protein [Paraburkholderia sp. J7]|uniref:hypothetical protein n=1 Tax=Paraburkholderia sp. J7 TaxID=2805438 RepID=UPI002AB66857|nr:hypothetical protein [Paraburkholderia sp. J7]
MTASIPYGTPTGLYLIIEAIIPKLGLPSFANTIDPSNKQIYRVVLQIYQLSDIDIDGKLVTDNMSLWDSAKGALGIGVTTRPNGESKLVLDYAGYPKVLQTLPEIGHLVPSALTNEHASHAFSLYTLGVDPLPSVTLYANPRVVFLATNGGRSVPTAMAKYNSTTRELVMLDTVAQIEQTKRELASQIPVLRF